MRLDLGNLPSEPALWHLVRDVAAVVERCDGEIERVKNHYKATAALAVQPPVQRLDPDRLLFASSPAIIFLPMTAALSRRACALAIQACLQVFFACL